MKILIPFLTAMAILTVAAPNLLAEEPPVPVEESISGGQRAGRILSDVLHLAGSGLEAAGSGLQWAGKGAKNVASGAGKGVSNLASKFGNRKARRAAQAAEEAAAAAGEL